jgi:hypothetical protein
VGRHVRYRWSDVQEWIEQQLEATPAQSASHLTSTFVSGGR